MKDLLKTLRLAAYVFALPLIATAAVSGHQFFENNEPVSIVATPKVETSDVELVGLNGTFRQHTVAANKDGNVSGRVWLVDPSSKSKVGLSDTKVFFVKDGNIASEVYTDLDGTFDVSGLVAGAYSFIVSNVEGVAVYGVNIVEDGEAGEMEVVVVSKNSDRAEKLINQENKTKSNTELTSEFVKGSNVAQLIDGQLDGQLHSTFENVDFTGTEVQIFNAAGEVVGRTNTDKAGEFSIEDLSTGYYEFVASGPQGVAAFGFEAIDSAAAYTSLQDGGFDAMVTSPADGYVIGDCGTCGNVGSPVEFAGGCSSCAGAFTSAGGCGGGCGGGGFGGGFGGGLGGLAGGGRLLAITGLALGIAGIADDNTSDPGAGTPSGIQ